MTYSIPQQKHPYVFCLPVSRQAYFSRVLEGKEVKHWDWGRGLLESKGIEIITIEKNTPFFLFISQYFNAVVCKQWLFDEEQENITRYSSRNDSRLWEATTCLLISQPPLSPQLFKFVYRSILVTWNRHRFRNFSIEIGELLFLHHWTSYSYCKISK